MKMALELDTNWWPPVSPSQPVPRSLCVCASTRPGRVRLFTLGHTCAVILAWPSAQESSTVPAGLWVLPGPGYSTTTGWVLSANTSAHVRALGAVRHGTASDRRIDEPCSVCSRGRQCFAYNAHPTHNRCGRVARRARVSAACSCSRSPTPSVRRKPSQPAPLQQRPVVVEYALLVPLVVCRLVSLRVLRAAHRVTL